MSGLLLNRIAELEQEVKHWKSNHATVVAQSRVLKERTDMPFERVHAYQVWGEVVQERDTLLARVMELEQNRNRSEVFVIADFLERSGKWMTNDLMRQERDNRVREEVREEILNAIYADQKVETRLELICLISGLNLHK